MDNSAITA